MGNKSIQILLLFLVIALVLLSACRQTTVPSLDNPQPEIPPAMAIEPTPKQAPPADTAPAPIPEAINKETTLPVPQMNPEPKAEPTPEPEIVDNPPQIVDYDSIPESIFVGDEIGLTLRAEDDHGIKEIIVNIKEIDEVIEEITLQGLDGLWEAVYVPTKEGNYQLTAKAIDSKDQTTMKELGKITIKEDRPPEIIDYTIPDYTMVYKKIDIFVESQDDRGVTEVKVKFEKRGTILDEIFLTETSVNMWETTYSLRTYNVIDYTITATDTKGQESYVVGEIFSEIGGGDGGGGSDPSDGCFTANTKALMADGNFKPIVDIQEGELVKGFDFETKSVVTNKVVNLFISAVDNYLLVNGQLSVTDSHPFAIGQDIWKPASELKVGDIVLGRPYVFIENIERVAGQTLVYNLAVDGTHNFFVAGNDEAFLVHNKGGG